GAGHRGKAGKSRDGGGTDAAQPFVMSEMQAREHADEAGTIRFSAGTRECDFIREEIDYLVGKALAAARRFELADERGRPVEPVQVAMALLMHLKDAIDPWLAVTVRERVVRPVGPRQAGHLGTGKPVLNGP